MHGLRQIVPSPVSLGDSHGGLPLVRGGREAVLMWRVWARLQVAQPAAGAHARRARDQHHAL